MVGPVQNMAVGGHCQPVFIMAIVGAHVPWLVLSSGSAIVDIFGRWCYETTGQVRYIGASLDFRGIVNKRPTKKGAKPEIEQYRGPFY